MTGSIPDFRISSFERDSPCYEVPYLSCGPFPFDKTSYLPPLTSYAASVVIFSDFRVSFGRSESCLPVEIVPSLFPPAHRDRILCPASLVPFLISDDVTFGCFSATLREQARCLCCGDGNEREEIISGLFPFFGVFRRRTSHLFPLDAELARGRCRPFFCPVFSAVSGRCFKGFQSLQPLNFVPLALGREPVPDRQVWIVPRELSAALARNRGLSSGSRARRLCVRDLR